MSVRLARGLLRHRKRWLECHVVFVPEYARCHSLELDRVVTALDALG